MPIDPTSPAAPQSAQIQTTSLVTWTTGENFNGYLWLGVVMPVASTYPRPVLWNSFREQQLPKYIQIPVIAGQVDNSTQVFLNANMDPPGTKYAAYWFDSSNNLIAPASGTATPFEITTITYVITPPTLTRPSYSQVSISAATTASPTSITTASAHGLTNGDTVTLAGFTANWLSLNASWTATVTGATTFTVPVDATGFGIMTGFPYVVSRPPVPQT